MNRSELYQILQAAGDTAFVVDAKGSVLFCNPRVTSLLGVLAPEMPGKDCVALLDCRDANGSRLCAHRCSVLDAVTSGARVSAFDAHVKTLSGSRKWVNISVFGAEIPSGRVAVHLLRDVDGQRHIYSLSRKIAALVHSLPGPFEPSDAELTARERNVLDALARGASTAAIARELNVSQATVRNHIQHTLRKLGVHSRLEAVARAAARGIP